MLDVVLINPVKSRVVLAAKYRWSLFVSFCLAMLTIVCFFNTTAFASNMTKKATLAEQQLERWVDEQLAPEVVKRLKKATSFANKPLLLVVTKNDKIQPRIDRFHAFVKQRLSERLAYHRFNIVTPSQNLIPGHHRQFNSPNCEPHNGVRAYLELELKPLRGRKIKAKFKFKDAYDQQTVSLPYEYASELKLWRYKAKDWQQMSVDEGLRGLRHLPFNFDQADLLAKYLADNLSCLMRFQLGSSLKIAVQGDSMTHPLDTVVKNLSAYLAENNEVTMYSNIEQANFVITVDELSIDQYKGLFQVRAIVEDLRTGELLGGAATSSYMSKMSLYEAEPDSQLAKQSQYDDLYQVASGPASKPKNVKVHRPIRKVQRLGVDKVINDKADNGHSSPLRVECVRYVNSSNCDGPYMRENKPWLVDFAVDSRYRGAMVIASMLDASGNGYNQITGSCSMSADGRCQIKFHSDAGLYKGGFAIEASIFQGNAVSPIAENNYFKRVYYTK